jgi:hypothetical protein
MNESSGATGELHILGVTKDGKTFRPSDWAERLAGVMAQFHPDAGPGRQLGYSPWCVPRTDGDVKCVVVRRELRAFNVMAWDFVVNFARDNHLKVVEK